MAADRFPYCIVIADCYCPPAIVPQVLSQSIILLLLPSTTVDSGEIACAGPLSIPTSFVGYSGL